MTTDRIRLSSTHGVFAVSLALALAVVAAMPSAASAAPTPFNKNLVKNAGAEDGQGTNGYTLVEIPRWNTAGGTVVRYGAPEFPTKPESERIGGGRKFFACGPNGGGVIYQRVRIRGRGADIDAGHVEVQVKAHVATYDAQVEQARMQVFFLDSNTNGISSMSTGSVSQTNGVFVTATGGMAVPPETRYLLVRLYTDVFEGDYCDGYFDKVSVKLQRPGSARSDDDDRAPARMPALSETLERHSSADRR